MSIDKKQLIEKHPLVGEMTAYREIFWENPKAGGREENGKCADIDIDNAEARLRRFAPLIEKLFPEAEQGVIESGLAEISRMKDMLKDGAPEKGITPVDIKGRLFLKCDSHLPVSGSIKARGGIYEALKLAERIAMEKGGLKESDNYSILAGKKYRNLFSKYKVAVGSTGNLGLSIGVISAALGFQVAVHMSADARQWKKDMLRSKGAVVVEYPDDYEAAVSAGRREAASDPRCHFVDDENSKDLFEGYAVAGPRLKKQLDDLGIAINEKHRLYVYLPCGVGGAPGGVAYGVRRTFGKHAYCFFAEPTHAPCMTLGLITGMKNGIAVGDVGIDGKTDADGLAVGRPSALVSDVMDGELYGCFTVDDSRLYPYLAMLQDAEGVFIEPSACAAFEGMKYICAEACRKFPLPDENSIHIVWATGGSMVPEEEKRLYYDRGCGRERRP